MHLDLLTITNALYTDFVTSQAGAIENRERSVGSKRDSGNRRLTPCRIVSDYHGCAWHLSSEFPTKLIYIASDLHTLESQYKRIYCTTMASPVVAGNASSALPDVARFVSISSAPSQNL